MLQKIYNSNPVHFQNREKNASVSTKNIKQTIFNIWFVKDHVTLKAGVMAAGNSAWPSTGINYILKYIKILTVIFIKSIIFQHNP